MSKNILFIAYYFPPTAGGGVQRATKFIKYLPSFGWKPVVLTVKNPDFDLFDDSLLNDISSCVKVYKAYAFDPVRWYRIRQYGMNSLFDRKNKISASYDRKLFRLPFLPLKAIMKHLLNNFVLIPDDYIGWIPFAVIKGYAIIQKEKIDVIYATGKPWSSFIIAFFLWSLTRKPYVLDLRDPWVLTPYHYGRVSIFKKMGEKFWERMCFSYAKKIININRQIHSSYIQNYPSLSPEKFTYITHGYDEDDFKTVEQKKENIKGNFTISYVGTLYPYESPENFLRAVKYLIENEVDFASNININFVGIVPRYVKSLIEENRLQGKIRIINYLSHRESIEYMFNADVLLLLLNKVKSNINAQVSTGKLFEYLASTRPILALIPKDTDAAELIEELGAGRVVDPEDLSGIMKAIQNYYTEHSTGKLMGHSGDINKYTRRELTRQLARILDCL